MVIRSIGPGATDNIAIRAIRDILKENKKQTRTIIILTSFVLFVTLIILIFAILNYNQSIKQADALEKIINASERTATATEGIEEAVEEAEVLLNVNFIWIFTILLGLVVVYWIWKVWRKK